MTAIVTQGNAMDLHLPDECVDLLVTSPPYFGLRSYQDNGKHYSGQIGDEATPTEYLDALIACTREWQRVLKPGGSIFCNLGDKYAGTSPPGSGGTGEASRIQTSHPGSYTAAASAPGSFRRPDYGVPIKSLVGLPWRYAIRCIDELGLILRAEIVWAKPNGLPESVTDRVRRSHEQVFHFVKQSRYYSAVDEVREQYDPATADRYASGYKRTGAAAAKQTANGVLRADGGGPSAPNPLGKLPGSVWTIPTAPLRVPAELGIDHFAAYPPELVRRIVLGWSPREVCTACGEGRRPITDVHRALTRRAPDSMRERVAVGGGQRMWESSSREIVYWACRCISGTHLIGGGCGQRGDTDSPTLITCGRCIRLRDGMPDTTTPGVVLDPFGGTGTTALVASAFGRVGISVDLSADYCRLARWRTSDPGERARVLGVQKPEPVPEGQLGMFDVDPAASKPSGGLAYAEKRGRNCTTCGYRTQYAGPVCDRCGSERGAA